MLENNVGIWKASVNCVARLSEFSAGVEVVVPEVVLRPIRNATPNLFAEKLSLIMNASVEKVAKRFAEF